MVCNLASRLCSSGLQNKEDEYTRVTPVKNTNELALMQIMPKKKIFFFLVLVDITLYMALLVGISKIAMLHKKVNN